MWPEFLRSSHSRSARHGDTDRRQAVRSPLLRFAKRAVEGLRPLYHAPKFIFVAALLRRGLLDSPLASRSPRAVSNNVPRDFGPPRSLTGTTPRLRT